MKNCRQWCVLVVLAILASAASALVPGITFFVDQVYSNADGTLQFVVIYDSGSVDCDTGEDLWANRTLVSTGPGPEKTFVFPTNLPTCKTSGRRILIASEGFAALGLITPDYVIPNGFMQIPNGAVRFAGMSQLTYTALPKDGVNAYYRDGTVKQNLATNFAGATTSIAPGQQPVSVTVVEYYHQLLDHYFMTALASDIAALDAGVFAGWARTGETFNAYPAQQANTVPTCRFFIPPEHGSSHFFSARAEDCAFLLMAAADPTQFPSFSGYIQEDAAAFYVTLPDATGACPMNTIPVFRLWNQRFDSNHRYTTKQAIVAQMQARNYVLEGALPNQAAMCAPM